jgi:hypothetical protein
MSNATHVAVEAHPHSATVYLTGRISVATIVDALRRCDALPNGVWLLRVDASAADPLDGAAHGVLMHGLLRWRLTRGATQPTAGDATWRSRDPRDPLAHRDRARRDPTVTRPRSLRYAVDAPFSTPT